MSRRKKPGTPGNTTIPREVVSAVTMLVQAEFKKRGCADYLDVFVVARGAHLVHASHLLHVAEVAGTRQPGPAIFAARVAGPRRPLGTRQPLGTRGRSSGAAPGLAARPVRKVKVDSLNQGPPAGDHGPGWPLPQGEATCRTRA
jgi:hypothetical protein